MSEEALTSKHIVEERAASSAAVRFGGGFADFGAMGAMILAALVLAIATVADLEWPCEIDFYRDMGAAQGMLDGNWLGDPAYAGAVRWYNPLTPGIFAALSWISSMPLHAVFTRFGPYVNILGPVFFAVLASVTVGRAAAVPALAAYLFLGNAHEPSWFHATYSPWSWPMNASQGFFYATLAAYAVSARSKGWRWEAATGVLLGITALSHTAPAIVMALVVVIHGLVDLAAPSREWPRVHTARRVLLIGGISFVISLPFLLPIFLEHRFVILNPIPSNFSAFWGRSFLADLMTPVTIFSGIGFVTALKTSWRRGRAGRPMTILLLALGVSFALFAYSLAAQTLREKLGIHLPQAVPAFHFHLYFKAIEAILFGIGVTAAAQSLWRTLDGRSRDGRVRQASRAGADLRMYGALITISLVALNLPSYVSGTDLRKFRNESLRFGADTTRIALYRWILANTSPDDVFLAEKDISIYAVAAAGRKVVVLDGPYSNPYLDYERRLADQEAMFGALQANDIARFESLAGRYGLRYVISGSSEGRCCTIEGAPRGFREVAQFGNLRVLER